MEVEFNLIDDFKNLTDDNKEFLKKCKQITQAITSKSLTIVQLVEKLGPLLVNTSPSQREIGCKILSEVLRELRPFGQLDSTQLIFICDFYADRLKDHHQVIPALLPGIIALTKFQEFSGSATSKLLRGLFDNICCQQQQQQDRANIYKIFEILQKKYPDEILSMKFDYVFGVISAVDGERDPKNLIFLFNWFPDFLNLVELGHLTEEAFEVLACYFPVDFKAPQQDSNTITRDDLAKKLSICLCAIPQFAQFCLPLALEKLDSSLKIAKLDALQLLRDGCTNFHTSSYIENSSKVLSQLQKELFNCPQNNFLEDEILKTLTEIVRKLSQTNDLVKFTEILMNSIETLKGNILLESKYFQVTLKFLCHIAIASKQSAFLINQKITPQLINYYNITETESHKIDILYFLIRLVEAYMNFYSNFADLEELNSIPVLCFTAILDETNPNLRLIAYQSLTKIVAILPENLRKSIYEHFKQTLTVPFPNNDIFMGFFEALSLKYPSEMCDLLILLKTPTKYYLELISPLAKQEIYVDFVLNQFLDLLKQDNCYLAIECLKNLLETNEKSEIIQQKLWEMQFLQQIIVIGTKCNDWIILRNLAVIIKIIVGFCDCEKQSFIVETYLEEVSEHVFLLSGLLERIHRNVVINYELLDKLLIISLKTNCNVTGDVTRQLLANLLNKCSNETVIETVLKKLNLEQNSEQNYCETLIWVTKALFIRNHRFSIKLLNKLIEMLDNKYIVNGFKVLMNDTYDSLSLKSNCLKTSLFQQKLFVLISNKLNEICTNQRNYLIAFGNLLEYAPRDVVNLQLEKVLKLVILCLEQCQEFNVLNILLETLKHCISAREKFIEDHIEEFLTRFLALSEKSPSLKIRILSLECVELFASSGYEIYKLLPHKSNVIRTLGKCVDDKKRLVRREAMEARNLWFLIDS